MSCCVPNSVSLICDYVIPGERGRAQSLFAAGVYLGVGLSSASTALDSEFGWRNAIRLVSVICLVFAVSVVFLKEPRRNETNAELIVV